MSLTSTQRQRLGELAREAKNILGGAVGPEGKPLTFAQLEEECIEAGDLFTALMLQERVANRNCEQLATGCPTCQREGALRREDEVRVLQTDRGDVVLREPTYYCPACRRAFFPSDGGIGPGV